MQRRSARSHGLAAVARRAVLLSRASALACALACSPGGQGERAIASATPVGEGGASGLAVGSTGELGAAAAPATSPGAGERSGGALSLGDGQASASEGDAGVVASGG